MSVSCKKYRQFLRAEVGALKQEIERHRRVMESELGRSVEMKDAEADYLKNNRIEGFAEGFRHGYCSICDRHDECGLKE